MLNVGESPHTADRVECLQRGAYNSDSTSKGAIEVIAEHTGRARPHQIYRLLGTRGMLTGVKNPQKSIHNKIYRTKNRIAAGLTTGASKAVCDSRCALPHSMDESHCIYFHESAADGLVTAWSAPALLLKYGSDPITAGFSEIISHMVLCTYHKRTITQLIHRKRICFLPDILLFVSYRNSSACQLLSIR